jgi:hypothetical protein
MTLVRSQGGSPRMVDTAHGLDSGGGDGVA